MHGQDAIFSQYYASSLYLNPAFSGSDRNLNVNVSHRSQWRSLGSAYTTSQVSLVVPIYREGLSDYSIGGAGASFWQSTAGDFGFKTMGANLSGSINMFRNNPDNALLGAIQIGAIQKSIDLSSLQWGSQFDRFNGFDASRAADPLGENLIKSRMILDLGAGFVYARKPHRDIRQRGTSFWMGVSGYHLNRANESMFSTVRSPMPLIYKGVLGIEHSFSPRFNIAPNALLAYQRENMQINGGLYMRYLLVEKESDLAPSEILLGAWYRVEDAIIGIIGISSNLYTLGFSYDLNQNGLKDYTGVQGAWEVTLRIQRQRKQMVTIIQNPNR
jgi:type IX secretion system PorP/SprF family membrane protein